MATLDTTPVSIFEGEDNPWVTYEVSIAFTSTLAGGAPSDPNLVEGWMKKNLGISEDQQLREYVAKHMSEVQGLDPSNMDDAALEQAIKEGAMEKKAQMFKRLPGPGDDKHPYLEGRQIKAMFREATNIAYPRGEHKWGRYQNTQGREVGGKAPIDWVRENIWVPEQPYPFTFDEIETQLAVGHIPDWRAESGKRATLTYFEAATGAELTFVVKVLDDKLKQSEWARIMSVAEGEGLGSRRSQGCGQFVTTNWERI